MYRAPLLHGRSDPEPAGDLWAGHGRRAGDPHRLGRGPVVGIDTAGLPRLDHPWRLLVLALPRDAAGGGGGRAARGLAVAAQDLVRPRGARRHPAAGHGGGIGHPAAALHDRDRHARRRHGGNGRRVLCADHDRASGDGRRDHYRRLCRGGDRRPGKFLGRGDLCPSGRRGARHHHSFPARRRRSVDLCADVSGVAGAPARVTRRAYREIRMKAASSAQKYRPLWLACLALVALPFALPLLGLSLTTGTMVVVLAIAAMGLNLCVGYTGLVSFGHGTWFGIGAYAAGLIQLHLFGRQIWLPLLLSMLLAAPLSPAPRPLRLRRPTLHLS